MATTYESIPIQTMSSFYGPGSPLAKGSMPSPANVASGGLPAVGQSASIFWVTLVVLLIIFRVVWERAPKG